MSYFLRVPFLLIYCCVTIICLGSNPSLSQNGKRDYQKPKESIQQILLQLNTDDNLSLDSLEFLLQNADSIIEMLEIEEFKGDLLLFRADLSYDKGIYSKALIELMKAVELFNAMNDFQGLANAYNRLGNVYISQAEFPLALDYFIKSLNLKDSLGDTKGMADTYSNIGNALFEMYDTKQALEYYMKSIELDNINGNEEGMAKTMINVGLVHFETFNYDEAIRYFEKSLAMHLQRDNKNEIANCYTNLALVYMETNKGSKAVEYFNKSLEIYKLLGAEQGLASVYSNLGFYYSLNGDYNIAIEYLKKAIRIAQSINSIPDIEQTSQALSDVYQRVGDYREAFNYYVLYKSMYDKLNNDNNSRLFTQMEMNYDFEQQRKEIEFKQQQKELEHQAKIKRQRMLLSFMISGAIALLFFAIFIFRSLQRKKRDNQLLREQKLAIENQRDKINKQNKDITASIQYAKRIQTALLPPQDLLDELLIDYFVLYKPRDIVSGDYYWISHKFNKTVIVAADCTGHGVPGAFMSMLGMSFLNEIIQQVSEVNSNDILNRLRSYIIQSLRQTGKIGENKDGMDLAMIVIDRDKEMIQFSGAYNPLILVRNGELIQYKADKMPIGISDKSNVSFAATDIQYQKGDTMYMYSDGYVDQFGGPKNAKFKSRPFKELLLGIQDMNMTEQKELLDENIKNWMGEYEQIDDIIVVGIRI